MPYEVDPTKAVEISRSSIVAYLSRTSDWLDQAPAGVQGSDLVHSIGDLLRNLRRRLIAIDPEHVTLDVAVAIQKAEIKLVSHAETLFADYPNPSSWQEKSEADVANTLNGLMVTLEAIEQELNDAAK
jgi:hypothetical protein